MMMMMMMIRGMRGLWALPYCPPFFLPILSASPALHHPGSMRSRHLCWDAGKHFHACLDYPLKWIKDGHTFSDTLPIEKWVLFSHFWIWNSLIDFLDQQNAARVLGLPRRSHKKPCSLPLDLVECLLSRCPFSEPSHHALRSPSHTESPV